MKVYVVVAETEIDAFDYSYLIIGVYQNEDDAIEKVADMMQDIEAYVKTYPDETSNEDKNQKEHDLWNDNFPHKINDEKVDIVYVKEFDVI